LTWHPWRDAAVLTERCARQEATIADLRARLAEQTRINNLCLDQIGAAHGVLGQPTFVKSAPAATGLGALPRLFGRIGSNVTLPGQDARPRAAGNGTAD
jgi:hypothetical protein